MDDNKTINGLEIQNINMEDDDYVYAYVSHDGRGCWWCIDIEGFDELPYDYKSKEEVKAAIIQRLKKENFDPAKLPCIEEVDPVLKQLWDNVSESENNMWFVENDASDYESAVWTEDFDISKEEYIRRVDAEIKKYHLENVIEKNDESDLLYTCYANLQSMFSEATERSLSKEDSDEKSPIQMVTDSLEEQASALLKHIRDIKNTDINHRLETVSLLMKDIKTLSDEMEYYAKCVAQDNKNNDLLFEYPNKTLHALSADDSVAQNGLDGAECSIIKQEFLPEYNMRCLLVESKDAEPIWVTYTNLVIPCDDPFKTYKLNALGMVSKEQLDKIKKIYSLEYKNPQSIEECFAEGFKSHISHISDMDCISNGSLQVSCQDGLNNVYSRYGSIALSDENLETLRNIIPDLNTLERSIFYMSQKVHEIAINSEADTLLGSFSRGFLGNEYDVLMSEHTFTDNRTLEKYALYDLINTNTMERIEPSKFEELSVKGLENVIRSNMDNNLIKDTKELEKIVIALSPSTAFSIATQGSVKILTNIVTKARENVKRNIHGVQR